MSQFKDPTTGNFYTQSLFFEICGSDKSKAIYTLKEHDHEVNGVTYKSLKRIYLSYANPHEYEFATENFYSWRHWERVCKNGLIAPYVQEWRDELEIKLRSMGVKEHIRQIQEGGKGALAAARYLANKEWLDKRGAGRPTKDEVNRELKSVANTKKVVASDLARIRDV